MYQILLVNDMKLPRASEKARLEAKNLKVIATVAGVEAVERAAALRPGLVVVDLEVAGPHICEQLTNNPRTADIPVLVLILDDDEETRKRCIEAGAAGFILKADGREVLSDDLAMALGFQRRYQVRVACQFTVGITDGGQVFSGTADNISHGGMFVTAEKRFDQGAALRLRFKLPNVGIEIQILGRVVRIEDITNTHYGHCIEFVDIDERSRQGFNQFLLGSI